MDERDAVLRADAERYRAMREGDLVALEALLAGELSYTHSSGHRDDKRAYLAAMGSGRFRYLETLTDEVQVQCYGAAAMMHGRARFHAIVDGVERWLDNRFLSVWVRRGDAWQMAAWASTPIPGAR